MFNSVALDVVIGLIFIYLLYSLLASVLSEIIATALALRAHNLREAIDRMLNDETPKSFWSRLIESVKLISRSSSPITRSFYNHPEIKYLGSRGIFKSPSNFKAVSFSKTLMFILFGDGEITSEKIDATLEKIVKAARDPKEPSEYRILDPETAEYIHSLWIEAKKNADNFRLQLEGWFDRTMEQTTEWYKRKIQVILLMLGFLIAWFFNVNTFSIVQKLSVDKDARDKMVSMANAYVKSNPIVSDTTKSADPATQMTLDEILKKQDSLLKVKAKLDKDIANARQILGEGGTWLPDKIIAKKDSTGKMVYSPVIEAAALPYSYRGTREGDLYFGFWNKTDYAFRMLYLHFLGFLTTAIAISLGAPFWFDLLNKLMKLRTSEKQETKTVASEGKTPPLPATGK